MGIIILVFTSFMFYKGMWDLHKEVFNEYKSVYIENSNEEAKRVVEYFIDTIKRKENALLGVYKQKLEQQTKIGCEIANFFYNEFKDKIPQEQLKKITLRALYAANKNFSVIEANGKVVLSPYFKKGENISNFEDAFGNKIFDIIKQDIENNANRSSFLFCYFNKRINNNVYGSNKVCKRIVYVRYFKPYKWYIADSVLYGNIEKLLKENVKRAIYRFRYGPYKKNYVFVLKVEVHDNKIRVTRVVNPNLPKKLIGTSVPLDIKDVGGKMFLKEMLKDAFTKGEGFVHYKFRIPLTNEIKEKTTFVKYYPSWHWLICSGYYPTIFYENLKKKDALLKSAIKENVKRMSIWLLLFGVFLFLLMLLFIDRIMEQIRLYRKELEKKERFQKHLVESIPNPLFILNEKGEFVGVNNSFMEFFGCREKGLCKTADDPGIKLVNDKSVEYLKGIDNTNPKEFNIADSEGKLRYVELYNSIFYDSHKRVIGVVGVLFDVTRSRVIEMELKEISIRDELTGLYNRRYFNEVLPKEMERAKRYSDKLSLIMYDLDRFKKINDTFGHTIGDYVLKEVSKIVSERIRKVDYVFRVGGEEFIILLVETDRKDAYQVAEKIRKAIAKHDFNYVGKITISLGVTSLRQTDNFDSIVKRVDSALYESKNKGRNRTTVI